MTAGDRCPLCGARMLSSTDRTLRYDDGSVRLWRWACGSCGLLCDASEDRGELDRLLQEASATGRLESPRDAGFGFDAYTGRTLSTRLGLAAEPVDERGQTEMQHPHGHAAASLRLAPLSALSPVAVSLGMILAAGEVEAVVARLAGFAEWTGDIVLLADAPAAPLREWRIGGRATVRLASHPLQGDFGRQRNRLQALSRSPWMVQLDADETVDRGRLFGSLAALAERDGVVSVGFPRRNLVDGVAADLFPDVQYRLNRRDVCFHGLVHERPERAWQKSFIALQPRIDHHLRRRHVERRSHRYEALHPGGGRLEEEDALLRPYRP